MSSRRASKGPAAVPADALLDVDVRLWVELGRASLPVSRAVALERGALVDLDKLPDDAVDVYVNGTHMGTGRLLVVDGEWAVRLETVRERPPVDEDEGQEDAAQ